MATELNEEERFQLEWIMNHHMEDKDKARIQAEEAELAARPQTRGPRGKKMRRNPSSWELPVPEDEIDLHGYTSEEAAAAVERRIDDLLIAGLSVLRVIHGGGNPEYGNVKHIIDRKARTEWSNRIVLYKVEPDNAGSSIMKLGKPASKLNSKGKPKAKK